MEQQEQQQQEQQRHIKDGREDDNINSPVGDGPGQTAESLLARELNKLSFQEREIIHEEIHGIGVGRARWSGSADDLDRSLRDLQTELDALCSLSSQNNNNDNSSNNNNGIAVAFRTSQELFGETTYLNARDTRIMFLRSERFDSRRAALRLCRFASLVKDAFGTLGLERNIELSDFSEHELALMKRGHVQILSARDRSGRKIYVFFSSEEWDELPVKTRTRIRFYYTISVVREDPDALSRGVVLLVWMHNYEIRIEAFIEKAKLNNLFSHAMPINFGAIHVLIPSSTDSERRLWNFSFGKVIASLAQKLKAHIRLHWGTYMHAFALVSSKKTSNDERRSNRN